MYFSEEVDLAEEFYFVLHLSVDLNLLSSTSNDMQQLFDMHPNVLLYFALVLLSINLSSFR